jgi:hypothetical protein
VGQRKAKTMLEERECWLFVATGPQRKQAKCFKLLRKFKFCKKFKKNLLRTMSDDRVPGDRVKVTGGAYKGSVGVVVMATPMKARVRMTDTGELHVCVCFHTLLQLTFRSTTRVGQRLWVGWVSVLCPSWIQSQRRAWATRTTCSLAAVIYSWARESSIAASALPFLARAGRRGVTLGADPEARCEDEGTQRGRGWCSRVASPLPGSPSPAHVSRAKPSARALLLLS